MLIADLHIHSPYSRATSKSITVEGLYMAAQQKGVGLIGSGDITHPAWFDEISQKLYMDDRGAYALKPELARGLRVPGPCQAPVNFILSGEISCIYKKNDKTRKIHCLIIMPDMASAARLNQTLDKIGNIKSDGRPILGLDARDLLEICLTIHPDTIFIPAHIWTPWFSLFGSKSGFNSIEECFEDLTPHISALETGLSSDPLMNWQLSALDGYTLVSNSDAHSLDTIAREANLLNCQPTFTGLKNALKGPGNPDFIGTIEFFPDEGKYHLDGHRNCQVRLTPEETIKCGGICPVCAKPLTVGVLSRVVELADRPLGYMPPNAPQMESLTSLSQTLGQALAKGAGSKAVKELKESLLHKVGSELFILRQWPLEEAARTGGQVLSEALRRLRAGQVILNGGYDGLFGTVELFSESERKEIEGQMRLVRGVKGSAPAPAAKPSLASKNAASLKPENLPSYRQPDARQEEAINYSGGHLQVHAGPGAGKTKVLTERIRTLVKQAVRPQDILAITFTRKAAEELKHRLQDINNVNINTFHGLGYQLLGTPAKVLSEDERLAIIKDIAKGHPAVSASRLAEFISLAKQDLPEAHCGHQWHSLCQRYNEHLLQLNALDLDDLVYQAAIRTDIKYPAYRHILVDEYQDVNPIQVHLLKRLLKDNARLMVIGDPRQAIYGFRGAKVALFNNFCHEFPGAHIIALANNYRSQANIVWLANQLLESQLTPLLPAGPPALSFTFNSPQAEARFIAARVLELLGGLDSRQVERQKNAGGNYAPKDIAILYRLHQQGRLIAEALNELGIPLQQAAEEPLAELEHMNFSLQKVSLLSMHAAKGLEFPVVFVCGLEEGLMPYAPPEGQPDIAEETRLLFVALTRAQERLFITRAKKRMVFGRYLPESDSPLWLQLEGAYLKRGNLIARPRKTRQLEMF